LETTAEVKAPTLEKPLRFPVQDIYQDGPHNVVVGRVESGTIRKGQKVIVLPSNEQATVAQLFFWGKGLKIKAGTGENPGLILKGPSRVKRGDVLVDDTAAPKLTDCFKANVFWLSAQPLETGREVVLRCATQEVRAKAQAIEYRMDSSTLEIIEEKAPVLKINEAAQVIFKTESSFLVEKFPSIEALGRFILESGNVIHGVGIVIQSRQYVII
jgi:sulfate adenylyltransferase subunit 1